MKPQAALLIGLLLTGLFATFAPTEAQPTHIPHENPTETQSIIDAYSFLSEYAGIFALMANRQYQNASDLSEQMSHITVPPELSYIINQYNQLTQQFITTLSDLHTSLDTASSLLDQNRLSEAGTTLEHAGVLVAKAQILLEDLKDATITLSQKLGIFASTAQTKVKAAYNQLENMLQRLRELIDLYHQLLQKANQRAQDIKNLNLKVTSLTLALNSTKCFVGSHVSVEGSLTSKGVALNKRVVDLFIDDTKVATTATNTNGGYKTTVMIPYKYVDSVKIYASYTPNNIDKKTYLASQSPTVKLQVLYYRTALNISVSDVAYPGLPLSVNGKVTAQDGTPLNDRQIKVYFDDEHKTQTKSSLEGTFNLRFTINASTQLGNHSLTITAQANELYAPTTEKRSITIQKMATHLQVNAPQFILLPTRLQITGTVSSDAGPLKEAIVQVEFTNSTTQVKTASNGTFNLTMDIPLNTVFAGYQKLTVSAQPAEPWQTGIKSVNNLFAINFVSTGLALASSISIFTVALIRLTKKKQKTPPNQSIGNLEKPNPEAPPLIPHIPPIVHEGIKGGIIKAYLEALTIVQTATGNTLTPTMTLREYNQFTYKLIGDACEPFTSLTILAERTIYSPHTPQQAELQKAEELKETLRRRLDAIK